MTQFAGYYATLQRLIASWFGLAAFGRGSLLEPLWFCFFMLLLFEMLVVSALLLVGLLILLGGTWFVLFTLGLLRLVWMYGAALVRLLSRFRGIFGMSSEVMMIVSKVWYRV